MDDTADVICPYCLEQIEIYVDPETIGELIYDCDVCCRPLAIQVSRSDEGELFVRASRSQ